jgi:hypothetical protein
MFKKLKFKIRNLVILIFSLSIIFIATISYMTIRSVIYDNFVDLSVKNISQKTNNIEIYFKLIEETSKQVSMNPDIINLLKEPNYDTNKVPILSNIDGVLGTALIDIYGKEYLSSYVTSYPSLEEIKNNDVLGKFMSSELLSFWSVRNKDIAGYYNNTHYDEKYGVVTFISKVINENNVIIGYLLIDIDPKYIYETFRNNNTDFSNDSTAFVVNSKIGVLPSKYNISTSVDLIKEIELGLNTPTAYKISSNKKYIITYNTFYDDNKIVVIVPTQKLFDRLSHIRVILIVATLLLIAISVLIGIVLTQSISMPLKDLYTKMQNSSV